MNPGVIADALLGLGAAAGVAATALSAAQRKARARARRHARYLEAALDHIAEVRREVYVHNLSRHPDGEGALAVAKLPDYLVRDDPEEV